MHLSCVIGITFCRLVLKRLEHTSMALNIRTDELSLTQQTMASQMSHADADVRLTVILQVWNDLESDLSAGTDSRENRTAGRGTDHFVDRIIASQRACALHGVFCMLSGGCAAGDITA